jgi:superfamily II DNA/RNA helicase
MSTQSFADLGLSRPVVDALTRRGITTAFPIQQAVIADVLAGRDVLVRSPTGSGKTLAFALPLVEGINSSDPCPVALILAPTRELATQIASEMSEIAQARSLRVATVYGGVGLQRQARAAARAHILVATPGRLEDLLARGAFSLARIRVLVLDEADRMLDMGFRPAVDRIVGQCRSRQQTLFLSATLAGESGRIAAAYTHDPVRREYVPEPAATDVVVEHRFVEVEHAAKLDLLVHELSAERDLALVFVRTKRGADRLVKRLAERGVDAAAMHGNKTQSQRERTLAQFADGKIDTLVATDIAARGIDVDRVSHVINFDLPEDHDSYVHRVGRTARAGRAGSGITFLVKEERDSVRRIADKLGVEHGLGAGSPRPNGSGNSRPNGSGSPRPNGSGNSRPATAVYRSRRGSAGRSRRRHAG